MNDIERYYAGGQKVICDWMDEHQDDPDYLQQVNEIGERIYNDLQDALANDGNPLWIARYQGELSRLD
jgi:hypothetical protein